jgi:hypothetical protein
MERIAREKTETTSTANTRTPSRPKMPGGVTLAQVQTTVSEMEKEGRHDDMRDLPLVAIPAALEKSSEMSRATPSKPPSPSPRRREGPIPEVFSQQKAIQSPGNIRK